MLDQRPHIPEEECQQQRADMGAVHIGIGHDDDLVIPELFNVEFVPDARAQRHDQGIQLVVAVDLIRPGFFHVEHLAPHGEDGLEPGVPTLNGGTGCAVALHDVDFAKAGVPLVAVLKLVGHLAGFQPRLAADGFPGFPGGLPGAVGHHGLVQHGLGNGGVFLKIGGQLVVYHLIDQSTDIGVAQLGFGLTLELGVGELDGNNGGDALPAILAGNLVVALDDAVLHAVGVENTGQRGFEAGLVHTALRRAHVVGEGQQKFVVAVVILHGDLGGSVALAAAHIDNVLAQWRLVPVAPDSKLPDAALVAHGLADLLFIVPVVGDGDGQTRIQEGFLPHPLVEDFVVIDKTVEHLRVGLEGDLRAGLVGLANDAHFLRDIATGKFHFVDAAVFVNPHPQPLAQSVDDGRAHAVQAAGDLITAAAELAAGMEHGIHDLQSRAPGLGLDVHGDTTAVVGDGDGVAGIDGHGNMLTVSCQRFVNGVIHDLIDQVVQTGGGGRADIHTGSFPHRFQTLQNLNLLRAVFLCYFRFVRHICPPA